MELNAEAEAELIALGIQSVENLFEYFKRRKQASGLTDQQLLDASAKINDAAIARTQAFLSRLNAEG
jgi:hypothetical protein